MMRFQSLAIGETKHNLFARIVRMGEKEKEKPHKKAD